MKTFATSTNRRDKNVITIQCQSPADWAEFVKLVGHGQADASIGGAFNEQRGSDKLAIAAFTVPAVKKQLEACGWQQAEWTLTAEDRARLGMTA
jgi:hypothetical protein